MQLIRTTYLLKSIFSKETFFKKHLCPLFLQTIGLFLTAQFWKELNFWTPQCNFILQDSSQKQVYIRSSFFRGREVWVRVCSSSPKGLIPANNHLIIMEAQANSLEKLRGQSYLMFQHWCSQRGSGRGANHVGLLKVTNGCVRAGKLDRIGPWAIVLQIFVWTTASITWREMERGWRERDNACVHEWNNM